MLCEVFTFWFNTISSNVCRPAWKMQFIAHKSVLLFALWFFCFRTKLERPKIKMKNQKNGLFPCFKNKTGKGWPKYHFLSSRHFILWTNIQGLHISTFLTAIINRITHDIWKQPRSGFSAFTVKSSKLDYIAQQVPRVLSDLDSIVLQRHASSTHYPVHWSETNVNVIVCLLSLFVWTVAALAKCASS